MKAKKVKQEATMTEAIKQARANAASGPRVAAVLKDKSSGKYGAVSGFMDRDLENVEQVCLVTPDGRVWMVVK